MAIVLFAIGGIFLLLAYLIGIRKMSGLIAGVNTATAERKAKMNLPAICRTLGIGFAVIGGVFILAGILSLAGIRGAIEGAFALLFLGIWFMVLFVQKYDGSNVDSNGKPTKLFYISIIGVSALMLAIMAFAGWFYSATLRDPVVTLADDEIVITSFYGTEIPKAEIEEISLYDEPLAFRARTNGSAALDSYKGNFTSDELGPVLVYAKGDSAPWIGIFRNDKKPVLIGLSNSQDTVALYEEIAAWLEEQK